MVHRLHLLFPDDPALVESFFRQTMTGARPTESGTPPTDGGIVDDPGIVD
jgi:hypothetical protein